MENLKLMVCIMHRDKSWNVLFEDIPTWEKADLIAQYAMNTRTNEEDVIFIFPGWNRGLYNYPDLWLKANRLAQKYTIKR